AWRVARCSLTRPVYSTGMSHPPKSTILAPKRRCAELSAVLRSCAVVGTVTGLLEKEICSRNMANTERNMRPRTESRKPPFRALPRPRPTTQVRTCVARARAENLGQIRLVEAGRVAYIREEMETTVCGMCDQPESQCKCDRY